MGAGLARRVAGRVGLPPTVQHSSHVLGGSQDPAAHMPAPAGTDKWLSPLTVVGPTELGAGEGPFDALTAERSLASMTVLCALQIMAVTVTMTMVTEV